MDVIYWLAAQWPSDTWARIGLILVAVGSYGLLVKGVVAMIAPEGDHD
jgi:hypothetical protein